MSYLEVKQKGALCKKIQDKLREKKNFKNTQRSIRVKAIYQGHNIFQQFFVDNQNNMYGESSMTGGSPRKSVRKIERGDFGSPQAPLKTSH